MSLDIVHDLTKRCLDRQGEVIRQTLDIVDFEPRLVISIAMGVALTNLRECVAHIAEHVPVLQKYPEAIQVAILSAIMARVISKDDYDKLERLPEREFGHVANEIVDALNSVKGIEI